MEMHSAIIFITAGKPAILLRQAEDTFKGQMWRNLGMQNWILELNVSGADEMTRHVFEIIHSYPEALRQAETARNNADRAAVEAFRKTADNNYSKDPFESLKDSFDYLVRTFVR